MTAKGCREWLLHKNKHGYGTVRWRGRTRLAHRIAWELTHAPIEQDQQVLHHCDNPACIEPGHLFLGTPAENMADMSLKWRGSHKLTPEQVAEIRSTTGSATELSQRFGVSESAVYQARAGKTFKHYLPTKADLTSAIT